MVALANAASPKANGLLLGFLNPGLHGPRLGFGGTAYATALHDIAPVPGGAPPVGGRLQPPYAGAMTLRLVIADDHYLVREG
ncbi:hypothetical protein B4Q13_17635, partial [Lacticaseibacillus rhamnosus]